MNEVLARLAKIRVLILDVDGILTDGNVWIGSSGEEMKRFSIRDGYGIKLLQRFGMPVALISGRHSEATAIRARELGIEYVYQGSVDKLPAYEGLLGELRLRDEEVAFMGDDWMDVPLLRRAGFSATVPDAPDEVRSKAQYVTSRRGGEGAVREVVELIFKARDPHGEFKRALGLQDDEDR